MSTVSPAPTISAAASKEERIQYARDRRDASIAKLQPAVPATTGKLPPNVMSLPAQLLADDEIAITQKPVQELLELLATGKLTAIVVARAFLRRAAVAQNLVSGVGGRRGLRRTGSGGLL